MIKNHTIVIPFNLPWEWSTDYTNQTAYILSKKNTVVCYMWSEALSIKEYLQKGKIPKIIVRHSKNLYLYYPLYLFPLRRFKFVSALNADFNIFWLKLFINYFEITRHFKKKIVWIFYPNLVTISEKLGKKYFTIFDCVDFFAVGTSAEKKEIIENERKLLKYADLVVANSKVLRKYLKKNRKDVNLVPQGFRLESFEKKIKKTKKLNTKGPIIGFVGAVNYRIDYSLLIRLAKRYPNWNFVLWGPVSEKERVGKITWRKMQTLLRLPNVIHGCSENKEEIPGIISQFDIGMIPYDDTLDFNKNCYPMKLFEYFYLGKPVVSTPIEELKRFPKFIKIGKTANEWGWIIKDLLSKPWPKEYKAKQKNAAEENSWEEKIGKITSVIELGQSVKTKKQ